MEIKYAVA